ncbi:MAG: hypothetical protein ABI947_10535 [Chloroflexota bacterium]
MTGADRTPIADSTNTPSSTPNSNTSQPSQGFLAALNRRLDPRLARVVSMGVIPLLFYFVFFCLLTYPLILSFSTHFFADTYDGFQSSWNLWWMNKSVLQLHQTPWLTTYLHYPYGIALIAHDLNPINAFVGGLLLNFVALPQAFNIMLIVAFTTSGLTAFWLAYYLTQSYAGSLLAGFVFVFSNYVFAHAHSSHLTIISVQWIPLFLLAFHRFIHKPSLGQAVLAALALLAVTLTNFYFVFYSVIAGGIMVLWLMASQRDVLLFFRRSRLASTLVFVAITIATLGPMTLSLVLLNTNDHIVPVHDTVNYSLDVVAYLMPGGHWRSTPLTSWYWTNLLGNADEHSAYLGIVFWAVCLYLLYVVVRRRKFTGQGVGVWFAILGVFAILSFGSILRIAGRSIPAAGAIMPYSLAEKLLPTLRVTGVPARMVILPVLCAAMICAYGFKVLFSNHPTRWWLPLVILIVLIVDMYPPALLTTDPAQPAWVAVLRDQPGNDAVVDTVTLNAFAMYYQTTHNKPISFGYTSRNTQSVDRQDKQLHDLLDSKQYARVCEEYKFRYLVTTDSRVVDSDSAAKAIYSDPKITVYDLGCIK